MEDQVKERFKEVNWDDLLPRLLLYTASLVRSYDLKGISAEDIVYSSITDLMSGRRKWPTNLPLLTALMGIARSKISHERELEGRREEVDFNEDLFIEQERATSNVEEKEFREKILRAVSDDPKLTRLVEAFFEDPRPQSTELAERLGVSIEEVYNLKKRLARKLSGVLHKR